MPNGGLATIVCKFLYNEQLLPLTVQGCHGADIGLDALMFITCDNQSSRFSSFITAHFEQVKYITG